MIDEAVTVYEKILKVNPYNQEVISKLQDLKVRNRILHYQRSSNSA